MPDYFFRTSFVFISYFTQSQLFARQAELYLIIQASTDLSLKGYTESRNLANNQFESFSMKVDNIDFRIFS